MMTANSVAHQTIFKYAAPLELGILHARYKRFLADINFNSRKIDTNGDLTTVHCPNTGSMYKLIPPDNVLPECACSGAPFGSKRKYKYTLEMIKENNTWVGVYSALANKMVENALRADLIEECKGFSSLRKEVSIDGGGLGSGKIDYELSWDTTCTTTLTTKSSDMLVSCSSIGSTRQKQSRAKPTINSGRSTMLLEVKSVTLALSLDQKVSAQFPDCCSERAQKHLRLLMDHVSSGRGRAAVLFLVQRDDCTSFSACHLDPQYGPLLSLAVSTGVEVLPYHCRLDPALGTVELLGKLPFVDLYEQLRESVAVSIDIKGEKKRKRAKKSSSSKHNDDTTTQVEILVTEVGAPVRNISKPSRNKITATVAKIEPSPAAGLAEPPPLPTEMKSSRHFTKKEKRQNHA